jgi:hypothetical protein
MPSHAEFKLSITRALTSQLVEALDELDPEPLAPENLANLDARPGVYQLYVSSYLVYVGSAENSLPQRLAQHRRKLSGRQNIDLLTIAYTALYVDEDMTVLAPENQLIRVYKEQEFCEWNTGGFGNNDVGKNRDTTELPEGHFDVLHPIRLDYRPEIEAGKWPLAKLLVKVKRELPFAFRYERGSQSLEEYSKREVRVAPDLNAREMFGLIAAALGKKWQITVFPGYAIMYRESREYPQGEVIGPIA